MENYNINRNQEPLSDADISKGQNFDEFMNAYSAKQPSFFKTTKFYAIAAVTGVILIGGGYLLMSESENPTAENTAFIQPLFVGAEEADTNFTVDASKGGMYFNSNGSIVSVPASAFLDSAGNPVSGAVELRYKEFHDPAKIFMAGIPMTYDSAGMQYNFESAGMIEISAWQNGKPLKVNPDSMIHVAIVSNSDEERFNTYYLDTAAKKWEYVNDAKAVVYNPPTTDSSSTTTTTTVMTEPPVAPKVADKNKPSFAISFDPYEFPELVAYKGVRFEVDENQTPYNKEDKKITWEEVVIKRMKNKDNFRVTFTAGSREAIYITQPVVDQKDFAAAQKSWEQRYAEYEAGVKQREELEKKRADALQTAMTEQDRHRLWVNDTLAERARQMRAAANLQGNTETMIMREFIISDFGMWNSDCPMSMPEGMEIFAKTDRGDGKPLDAVKVYLVQKNINALYQYYNLNTFRFDTLADNMLWAVTKDGRLATCSTDDFNAAIEKMKKDKAKEAIFKFEVSAGPVKNGVEARNMLGIADLTGTLKERT